MFVGFPTPRFVPFLNLTAGRGGEERERLDRREETDVQGAPVFAFSDLGSFHCKMRFSILLGCIYIYICICIHIDR